MKISNSKQYFGDFMQTVRQPHTCRRIYLSLCLFIRKEMQTIKNTKNSKTRNYTKQADRQMDRQATLDL